MDPKAPPTKGKDTPVLRLSDLAQRKTHRFALRPDAQERAQIAQKVGILGVKKLSFEGSLTPAGNRDWDLSGVLGATVMQPCVASLTPVTSRLDEPVERRFRQDFAQIDDSDDGSEMEMPDDDSLEPLPATIDLIEIMTEALSLALPMYPRAEGAAKADKSVTEPGKTPMTDEDAKPFAGLADLKRKLQGPDT